MNIYNINNKEYTTYFNSIRVKKHKTFYIYKYNNDENIDLYITDCIQLESNFSSDTNFDIEVKNKYESYFCYSSEAIESYINNYIINTEERVEPELYNANYINLNCLIDVSNYCINEYFSYVVLPERDDTKALELFKHNLEKELEDWYNTFKYKKQKLDFIENELINMEDNK